jgi:hypothetical protein
VSEFLNRGRRVNHQLKAGWYHIDNLLPLLKSKLTADQFSCVLKMIDFAGGKAEIWDIEQHLEPTPD